MASGCGFSGPQTEYLSKELDLYLQNKNPTKLHAAHPPLNENFKLKKL